MAKVADVHPQVSRFEQKACANPPSRNDEPDESAQMLFLRKENQRLARQIEKLKDAEGFREEVLVTIREAVEALEPLPLIPYKRPPKSSAEIAAVIKKSDWHIGARISAAETEGFGEFNWDIAQLRVRYITDKFIASIQANRQIHDIRKLYIFGEGDWVSGDIHEELVRTNEFPLPVQAVNAGNLLAEAVGVLAPHFEEVHLIEVSPDNHGRLERKPQFKQKAQNNMSFVTYSMANALLREHRNVFPYLAPGIKHVQKVNGVNFLIEHGDTVRAWMGIPAYGMERERGREAAKRMQAMMDTVRGFENYQKDIGFDYMSCGHWHVPGVVSGNILINGSLTGTDEFDHGCGRHAPPAQVSFLVHSKHKIFNWTPWTVFTTPDRAQQGGSPVRHTELHGKVAA